ncbi:MAG: GntR family transcriptional regulator [Sphaerochaeta sp.]|jgi:DNA-binding GntR family transcriptional regulator|uniref:GntR family transcriptional regulator n=1 Tax=Sphaerochaeta sp. TaxID=1972642 RepID=UPI002FC6638F
MATIVRVTASEEIYQTLRAEILSLRFKPGEEMNLQLLSSQLQVSRSPVRDALMRLSSDNLVDIFPQKGTRVSLINLRQVEEERFLRKSLEESAVKKFIYQAREEHYERMERTISEQAESMKQNDFVSFLEADDLFHSIIFEGIGMTRIWKIIKAQGGNHHRIRLLSFYEKNVLANIIDQHKEMVEALRYKQMDSILRLEDKHLSKLLQETESMFQRYPGYFKQESVQTGLQARIVNL